VSEKKDTNFNLAAVCAPIESLYSDIPYSAVLAGDARTRLDGVYDDSVSVVVTSPPYWLKRIETELPPLVWGEDTDCDHDWGDYWVWSGNAYRHGARRDTTAKKKELMGLPH